MNAEKYTQKALEAVKTAQNMAQENGNQYVTTEHLLYALLDQDGGLIGSLFGKMGVDCDGLLSELDTLIRNLPRISGGSGEVYASPEVGKILNLAEKTAEKLHDEYLSVEHLMLAIFSEGSQSVRQLLSNHGITSSRFSDELATIPRIPTTRSRSTARISSSAPARRSLTPSSAVTQRSATSSAFCRVRRRTTPYSSASRASARRPSPRALPSVSCAAMCPKGSRTARSSRSTWAR